MQDNPREPRYTSPRRQSIDPGENHVLSHTERRDQARAILHGTECLSPASVFDPLSARVAEMVGYKLGLLSGSVASSTTLAAPDLIVLTLTEFAEQVRRIMRASSLSLVVEADTLAQIEAVHAAVDLPLIVGSGAPALKREALAQLGGRILLQGHQSLAAAVEALHDVYTHLHTGGEPAGLQMKVASGEKMDCLVRGEEHRQWQRLYLR